jgi:threonine/homoserine/homoserine lactone efflux protein
MNTLSPPKSVVWWIALILTVLAALMHFGVLRIAALAPYTFWMILIAAVLLLIATRVHGL